MVSILLPSRAQRGRTAVSGRVGQRAHVPARCCPTASRRRRRQARTAPAAAAPARTSASPRALVAPVIERAGADRPVEVIGPRTADCSAMACTNCSMPSARSRRSAPSDRPGLRRRVQGVRQSRRSSAAVSAPVPHPTSSTEAERRPKAMCGPQWRRRPSRSDDHAVPDAHAGRPRSPRRSLRVERATQIGFEFVSHRAFEPRRDPRQRKHVAVDPEADDHPARHAPRRSCGAGTARACARC